MMSKKKLTLAELREKREDIDQSILQTRKLLETHAAERERLYSPENKRRLSPQGLAEDEAKLRKATESKLAAFNARIAAAVTEAVEHRDTWTVEHALRTSRFAPEANGNPGTPEAQQRAINLEMLEAFKRGNAENRAARFTPEDLATEAGLAAERGDVATVAVYAQAARDRQLAGLEKLAFDTAFKKLALPEIEEAQGIFTELEGLASEADSLVTLWKEPRNEIALGAESLGRFNRKRRAEEFVKKALSEAEAQQHQDARAPAPPIAA
jgi:hypothetical protein